MNMFGEFIHITERVITIVIAGAIQFVSIFGILEDRVVETPPAHSTQSESLANTPLASLETSTENKTALPQDSALEDASHTQSQEEHLSSEENTGETTPSSESPEPLLTTELNTQVRDALVNILCTTRSGSGINASSGSGIIIDERGVILTNTHVAQYMLLEDKDGGGRTNCVIRGNAPAENLYTANPLFLSSSWIEENAETIAQNHPRGTGEYDVALLLITESLTADELPETFPFIPLTPINDSIEPETDVLVAGYPAEFLSGNVITRDLWPVTAITDILDVYTFSTHSVDVFSVAGNIAAQQGSSGGGIIDIEKGTLSGIVVTSSYAEQTEERELNAVTHRHINHTLFTDTGMALSTYLSGDLEARAKLFMEDTAPDLRNMLLEVIKR